MKPHILAAAIIFASIIACSDGSPNAPGDNNPADVSTNDLMVLYYYFPEDTKINDTWDLFPNQNVRFITDIDVKKGWNLYYYKNEYEEDTNGEIVQTVIKTSNASILKGAELKWVLFAPEV